MPSANAIAKPDVTIELSIPGVVAVSSDFSALLHSKDDPNIYIVGPVVLSQSEEPNPKTSDFKDLEGFSTDEDFQDLLAIKRKKSVLKREKSQRSSVVRSGNENTI